MQPWVFVQSIPVVEMLPHLERVSRAREPGRDGTECARLLEEFGVFPGHSQGHDRSKTRWFSTLQISELGNSLTLYVLDCGSMT